MSPSKQGTPVPVWPCSPVALGWGLHWPVRWAHPLLSATHQCVPLSSLVRSRAIRLKGRIAWITSPAAQPQWSSSSSPSSKGPGMRYAPTIPVCDILYRYTVRNMPSGPPYRHALCGIITVNSHHRRTTTIRNMGSTAYLQCMGWGCGGTDVDLICGMWT